MQKWLKECINHSVLRHASDGLHGQDEPEGQVLQKYRVVFICIFCLSSENLNLKTEKGVNFIV